MGKQFGPLKLPQSGKEIIFRQPTGGDRLEVLKSHPIGSDDIYSGSQIVDTYLAAKCIVSVDGKQSVGDYKHMFRDWPLPDSTFYASVFNKVIAANEDMQQKVNETVDFLLNSSASSVGSTSMTLPEGQ